MTEEDRVLSGEEVPELAEEMDIETLKGALAEEKEKAETYLANWQRAEADFSNYKKRAEQERNELGNSAMLPSFSVYCRYWMTWSGLSAPCRRSRRTVLGLKA